MTNVALIILDTLRNDIFESTFDWLPGRKYTRMFSTSNWTVPAHVSLLFGEQARHPECFERLPNIPSNGDYLPVVANQYGCKTVGLSANSFISTDFGWAEGFDHFHELSRWAPWGKRDKEGKKTSAREALDLVERLSVSDDTFLYINLMEVHWPYTTPGSPEVPNLNPVDSVCGTVPEPEELRDAYETAANELSRRCRPLLEELQFKFDYIFVTSDHGELLGEYDYWAHEYGLHPELVRVPLHVIGDSVSGTDHKLTNLRDIYSSIRSLYTTSSRAHPVLTGDQRRRYCLTECFGVSDDLEEDLQATDKSSSWIETHKQPIVGVADQEGYIYQHLDEIKGSEVENIDRFVLNEIALNDFVDVKKTEEMDENVRERLEALGYR